jgi:hypothetical protein
MSPEKLIVTDPLTNLSQQKSTIMVMIISTPTTSRTPTKWRPLSPWNRAWWYQWNTHTNKHIMNTQHINTHILSNDSDTFIERVLKCCELDWHNKGWSKKKRGNGILISEITTENEIERNQQSNFRYIKNVSPSSLDFILNGWLKI